jgi:hypothetical protein
VKFIILLRTVLNDRVTQLEVYECAIPPDLAADWIGETDRRLIRLERRIGAGTFSPTASTPRIRSSSIGRPTKRARTHRSDGRLTATSRTLSPDLSNWRCLWNSILVGLMTHRPQRSPRQAEPRQPGGPSNPLERELLDVRDVIRRDLQLPRVAERERVWATRQ